jgi:hypothetical protein
MESFYQLEISNTTIYAKHGLLKLDTVNPFFFADGNNIIYQRNFKHWVCQSSPMPWDFFTALVVRRLCLANFLDSKQFIGQWKLKSMRCRQRQPDPPHIDLKHLPCFIWTSGNPGAVVHPDWPSSWRLIARSHYANLIYWRPFNGQFSGVQCGFRTVVWQQGRWKRSIEWRGQKRNESND